MLVQFLANLIGKRTMSQLEDDCRVDRQGNPYSKMITAVRGFAVFFIALIAALVVVMYVVVVVQGDVDYLMDDLMLWSTLMAVFFVFCIGCVWVLRTRYTLTDDNLVVRGLFGSRTIPYEALCLGARSKQPALTRFQTMVLPVHEEKPVKMRVNMFHGCGDFIEQLEERAKISVDMSNLRL